MSAKEKKEMIIPDSKVESLFIELENIFDNYDGYDRRLKAYEIINAALYSSEGKQQASTASNCNLAFVMPMLRQIAEYLDCGIELANETEDESKVLNIPRVSKHSKLFISFMEELTTKDIELIKQYKYEEVVESVKRNL